MKATQNKIGIKVLIGILLMAIMVSVLLCAAFSVFAENDVQTDEVIEVHDLAPIEISAPSISTFTLDSDGKVALKDGNYVKWIDRIDLTGADYAVRLYQWLEANADVDGALADPTKGQYITDGTYGYLIETFE